MIIYKNGEDKTVYSVIYYAACALHNDVLPGFEDALKESDELYIQAKRHSMASIVCTGMEICGLKPDKIWIETKNKAIRKNMLLSAEKSSLCDFFEKEKIWNMPLKGSVMKDIYPLPGMREMSDIDILYDASFQEKVKEHMLHKGYEAEMVGKTNHDVYLKEPLYNFELHRAFFGVKHDKKLQDYYKDIDRLMIKDEGCDYGYHLSKEDFYIFMIAHMYKHYSSSGTGLRSLMDIYVYVSKMSGKLDKKYITEELKKLGIMGFESENRKLARMLFDSRIYGQDKSIDDMILYYAVSGTYGNRKIMVENGLKKYRDNKGNISLISQIKYIFHRAVPDMDFYKSSAPFVYKHKWLIPFFVVFRIFRGIILRHKVIVDEIKMVISNRNDRNMGKLIK